VRSSFSWRWRICSRISRQFDGGASESAALIVVAATDSTNKLKAMMDACFMTLFALEWLNE
jgi:hypothetical protein